MAEWRAYHNLGTTATRKRPDHARLAVGTEPQERVPEDGDEVGVGSLGGKVAHKNAKLQLLARCIRPGSPCISSDPRSSGDIALHFLLIGTANGARPVRLDTPSAASADPRDAVDATVHLGKGTSGSRGRGKDKDSTMGLHAHIDDVPALGMGHLQDVRSVHPRLGEDNVQLALDGRGRGAVVVVVRIVLLHGVRTEVLGLTLGVLGVGVRLGGPAGRRAASGAVGAADGASATGEESAGVALVAGGVVGAGAVVPDGIGGGRWECERRLGRGRKGRGVGRRRARGRGGEGVDRKHGEARLGRVSTETKGRINRRTIWYTRWGLMHWSSLSVQT